MLNEQEILAKAQGILGKFGLKAVMESALWVVKSESGQVFARMSDPIHLTSFAEGVAVGLKIAREASK